MQRASVARSGPDRTAGTRPFALRHAALVAVGIAVLLSFAGIFQHGLWTPDEPREAEIGREMLLSHWSAVPTLGGVPFLEKPPLFVWIMAAAFKLFGVSPGVARLPGALFSVGAAGFAYLMGRRAGGRTAGVAAAVVLLTCNEFAEWSHRAVNDTALTFFVAAGHWAFLVARDEHRLGRRTAALVAAGGCAGLAFLTKGPVGPALLAGPPILAAAATKEWAFVRHALPRAALWCAVFVVALGLPWVLCLAASQGWGAVHECLVKNTVGRTLGGTTEEVGFLTHTAKPWYYATGYPQGLFPWALAIPALFFGGTLGRTWRGGRSRHLAFVALAGVLLLSIPAGKRGLYVVPLFPVTAAVIGTWLSRAGSRRGGRLDRATVVAILGLVTAAAAAAAWITGGAPIPSGRSTEKLDAFLALHAAILPAVTAVLVVVAAWFGWLAVRATRCALHVAARNAAVATAAGCFLIHAGGRPLIDRPLHDMEDGARALAAAVPDGEEMLAVGPDETTRAVVPFYTGRMLRAVPRPRAAPGPLGRSPWRYLVVEDSSEKHIDAETRGHLHLEKVVPLAIDREVRVYRYDP